MKADFWYGIKVVFEATYFALKDFVDIKHWDWEAIGCIVGGVIIASMIILPIVALLHWVLP
jgi:hypothetical protein